MKIDPKKHRCLLVDKLEVPAYRGEYSDNGFFAATVACFSDDGSTPRNWSLPYSFERFAGDTGGCQISAFVSKWRDDPAQILVSTGGPNVHKGGSDDYRHALSALGVISRRLRKYYDARGPVSGPGEEIARWVEATGVKAVFLRPEQSRNEGWLNRGDWLQLTPGQFNSRLLSLIAKLEAAA